MIIGIRPLLFAWQFLTAVPVSRAHHEPAPDELAGSMVWYPLVGALLGGALAATHWLLLQWMPREVVSVTVIVVLVALTRGLHQDGLADTFDGLAGGRARADRLAIMRDPRIGAIGATGLFLSLILRYAALQSLPLASLIPALVCMPAVGRLTMVAGAYRAPYARAEGGLAAPFLTHLSLTHVLGATLSTAGLLVWMFDSASALVVLLWTGLLSRGLTAYFCRVFGGVTGDTIGATNEAAEILFLIAVPWFGRFA